MSEKLGVLHFESEICKKCDSVDVVTHILRGRGEAVDQFIQCSHAELCEAMLKRGREEGAAHE